MPQFPHLPLPKKYYGQYKHKPQKVDIEISPITLLNRDNRANHGKALKKATSEVSNQWNSRIAERRQQNLPEIPSTEVIPIFLKVDTGLFKPDSLYSFGIEVISEESEGYIIGAASDNFISLKAKIDRFIQNQGKFKNKAAELWEITMGDGWKLNYVISEELNKKWDEIDNDTLIIDISIACLIKISDAPTPTKKESKKAFDLRYNRWIDKKSDLEAERLELEEQRQEEFDNFLSAYGSDAERLDSFINYEDSFGCRLRIKGTALKDLVLTYQYLFDVAEYDTLKFICPSNGKEQTIDLEIEAPTEDCPRVCVIDSGIQEAHPLLKQAIEYDKSISYIPTDASTTDGVLYGGHGTKVAGAILFGNEIPKDANYIFDIWIQNARILNNHNICPSKLYPPVLMKNIVDDFLECKVFNLSVNSNRACKTIHMSQWATTIDQLMYEKNKLFIISSGNIDSSNVSLTNPGVKEHIRQGRNYPEYLLTNGSRVSNPAQSCFALSVGSVCSNDYEDDDLISFGKRGDCSAFTRTGPSLWGMIKPDIVEYGGDFIREKNANPNISVKSKIAVEVVKTTLAGGNAIGFDIGTSYAAPKVSHIAGKILNVIPNSTPNLLRALIAQSARLPEEKFRNPTLNDIRCYGYGIPEVLRATQNSESRITLVGEGEISAKQAHIYSVSIPENIRSAGNDFDILIEVTLAYMAKPRRTRRRTTSYLSTWLDWKSSKFDESFKQFKARVTKFVEGEEFEEESDSAEPIKWSIRENPNWGSVKRYKRQDSTLQKDWTVLQAYILPDELSLAVIGHKGWEKDVFAEVPYSITVSFEVLNEEINIYEAIRIENEIEIEQEIQLER